MRDLDKDRALCEAATAEPWKVEVGLPEDKRPAVITHFDYDRGEWFIHGDIASLEDAQFIAEARTALPYWIDQYEEVLETKNDLSDLYEQSKDMRLELINRLDKKDAEIERVQQENERLKQALTKIKSDLSFGNTTEVVKAADRSCAIIDKILKGE